MSRTYCRFCEKTYDGLYINCPSCGRYLPPRSKGSKEIKVLFLDIDGVVNCASTSQRHRGFIGIDPVMAFMVGKIQLDTGCEVVLSSSWRHWPDGREEVERQVVKLLDVTPTLDSGFRGDEINAWLENHPEVVDYAILDDTGDFHKGQPLFKTEWLTGITEDIAKSVTKYLNGAE